MPETSPPHGTGLLVAISSPSGGGKTSVIREIRKLRPVFGYSVSCTTRKPRPGEMSGRDYIFISDEEFQERIARNEFLEWEWVHSYRYGTLKETVAAAINAGEYLLFDIDVHGAKSLKEAFPNSTIQIFLTPPDLETLIHRLKSRAEDSEDEIYRRLERVKIEMDIGQHFEVVIVNDVLSDTVRQVLEAIDKKLNLT